MRCRQSRLQQSRQLMQPSVRYSFRIWWRCAFRLGLSLLSCLWKEKYGNNLHIGAVLSLLCHFIMSLHNELLRNFIMWLHNLSLSLRSPKVAFIWSLEGRGLMPSLPVPEFIFCLNSRSVPLPPPSEYVKSCHLPYCLGSPLVWREMSGHIHLAIK